MLTRCKNGTVFLAHPVLCCRTFASTHCESPSWHSSAIAWTTATQCGVTVTSSWTCHTHSIRERHWLFVGPGGIQDRHLNVRNITRQLSYRKDDRTMRPIYGRPEKFRESSLRTRLLFPKFVTGFCSDRY